MVRKKVDERLRTLLENGVKNRHRSLIVLVGDGGKDQVVNIHYILSKLQVKARPSVLWCYKKELGFSTHKKKRMRQIKKQVQRGLYDAERDDPFELFVASTQIQWRYYKDTDKVLGQTFGMCVLQDFEALTPNLLARTVETVVSSTALHDVHGCPLEVPDPGLRHGQASFQRAVYLVAFFLRSLCCYG